MIPLATCVSYHGFLFIFVAILTLIFSPFIIPQHTHTQLILVLLLFFGIGIPHGALDVAVGRKVFNHYFPRRWVIPFFGLYLACAGVIIILWLIFPLLSFLAFLAISVIHFGLSDTDKKTPQSFLFILERVTRGILPFSLPAYINSMQFLRFIEMVLTHSQAILVLYLTQVLFWLGLMSAFFLIGYYIRQATLKREICLLISGGELLVMIPLFTQLPPFTAFLIYFCFLHSIRHMLAVLQTKFVFLNKESIYWLLKNSLPITCFIAMVLCLAYSYFQAETKDHQELMMQCFFLSLAALTFPHMILIEWEKKLFLRSHVQSMH